MKQLQKIYRDYEKAGNPVPASTREVAAWAVNSGLWRPRPADLISRCTQDLSKALREVYRTDKQGRRYRAMHSFKSSRNGKQLNLWADIDLAPRKQMQKAFAHRRKQIVSDCYHLRTDVDHYNYVRKDEEPIQLILDFTDDVAEMQELDKLNEDAA